MPALGVDAIVTDYLHRLTGALAPVPQTRRAQIIKDASSQVHEMRTALAVESPGAVLEILDRVGRPEDLALRTIGDQRAAIESRRRRGMVIAGLILIGLGTIVVLTAILLGS